MKLGFKTESSFKTDSILSRKLLPNKSRPEIAGGKLQTQPPSKSLFFVLVKACESNILVLLKLPETICFGIAYISQLGEVVLFQEKLKKMVSKIIWKKRLFSPVSSVATCSLHSGKAAYFGISIQ